MSEKVDLTILKRNELIRGHGKDGMSIYERRALNAIYWGAQKSGGFDSKIMHAKFSDLRKLMHLENDNNYVDIIEKALLNLTKTIVLRNYTAPDGIEYRLYTARFVDYVKVTKGDVHTVKITFNKEMNELLKVHKNFTKLEFLKYSNTFQSKYTVALYEYLKSFETYRYIDMSMESINELLEYESLYFSKTLEVVERVFKEIIKKSDLKDIKKKVFKKQKYIRFYLNPNASKEQVKKMLKLDQLFTAF